MNKASADLKTALFKLAYFEPNVKDENNYQVLDYLILDCLSTYSPMLDCSPEDIHRRNKYLNKKLNLSA